MSNQNDYAESSTTTVHDTTGRDDASTNPNVNSVFSPSRSTKPAVHNNATSDEINNRSSRNDQRNSPEPLEDPIVAATASLEDYRDVDERLEDYSLDFEKLSTAQFTGDNSDGDDSLPGSRQEELLDVGGPEDFTINMGKYLFGHVDPIGKATAEEQDAEEAVGDDDQQQGRGLEDSEFDPPPTDTSTPCMRRNEREEIGPEEARTGSAAADNTSTNETINGFTRQIAELQKTVNDRDERLEEMQPTAQQIERLQTEVHRKPVELGELLRAKNDHEMLLGEQVRWVQKQCDEKEASLQQQKSSLDVSGINAISEQIATVQRQLYDVRQQLESQHDDIHRQLQNGFSLSDQDAKTTLLRHQLDSAQDQLKSQNGILEQVTTKLRDVTTAKELELQQKQSDLEGLKAQTTEQLLDIERIATDVDQSNTQYKKLESRFLSLEDLNGQLEEKIQTLEEQLRAQKQALEETVAADLPIPKTTGNDFTELAHSPEDERSRQEVMQLKAELDKATASKNDMDAELTRSKQQASQLQTRLSMIEADKLTLAKHAEELHSKLEDSELNHADALRKIADLARRLQQLAAAEKHEKTLRSELTAQQEALLQAQDGENKRLMNLVAIKDEAAAVVDQRIARALDKREKEWRRREEILLREMDRMGNALMISWAENEAEGKNKLEGVAADGRIRYRYKYAKKEGKKGESRK